MNNCSSAVAITVRETGPSDLIVSTPTLSANTLPPGQSVTLTTTVQNQGIGPAPTTTLRGYLSSNANISDVDTEVGDVAIGFLAPGATQTVQLRVDAPVMAGTYYYGICVDDVRNESNTVNNCSTGVALTVENLAPVAAGTFPAQTLVVGTASVVGVAPYFSDPNEDTLTYKPSSSSLGIVAVEMSGLSDSHLRMNPLAAGTATVTVEATDPSGLTFSQTFSATVNPPPNRAPVALGTIQPETLMARGASRVVDVSGIFHDIDGDTLRYTVRSDNTRVLSTNVSDGRVTLVPLREGSASVTVTASDSELSATLSIAVSVTPYMGAEAWMPDATLRATVRATLGLTPNDVLTQQTMEGLIILNAASRTTGTGVQNLIGLEHATQLTILNLGRTGVRDLTPLQELIQLTQLNIIYTEVSDLTPLQGLTQLTTLNLLQTRSRNITPLQGLINLTSLNLERIGVHDLTPLRGLTQLTFLNLSFNNANGFNNPGDLTPLSGLTALTSLNLGYTDIKDITALKGLTALTYLDLKNNQISDIASVSGLTQLIQLYLEGNQISDVTPLEGLTGLAYLYLSGNPIADVAPLRRLKAKNPNVSIDVNIETQFPDLRVESVRVNKNTVAPGETFQFSAVIKNQGAADASAITVRYYQSADDTISSTDTERSTATLGVIAVDAMREPSVHLTAPDTPGIYYYGVCVDAIEGESDTTNNCSTGVAVTVGSADSVDLVIESINANKTTVKPGENFQISAVLGNQGEIAATATPIRYYLSTDENISTTDTEVHTATLPIIAVDATRQQSRQLTAPDTPGTYYYGVCIDAVAGESDTTNNCSIAVAVTVGGADLMIVGTPQVSKTTLSPGETFQINTLVRNQGRATSDATTLRYYLSVDETISLEDTEVDSDSVAALSGRGAHASRRRADLSKTLTAPDTPGTHYYGVCVDPVAGDANVSNNCSQAIAITVEAPPPEPAVPQLSDPVDIQGPDLIISAVRVDASTIKIGGGVRFHITLTNQGTSKAPATIIRYYRSTDATISVDDTELRAVPVGELGSGKSYTTWALLPSAFSVGAYYYGACLDGVASEFDTSNNCSLAIEIIMVLQSDPVEGLEPRGRIPAQTLKVEHSPEPLSVSRYFAGKVETWQASSSKPAVVAVSMEADSDLLKLAPVSEGHSVVAVTARHGDSVAQQTFDVYVGIDPTLVLRWVIPVPPQPLAVGGSPLVLDVSSHVENEVERWRAVSSHPGVVVVSLSGSVVTLTPVSEGNAEVTIHASGGTSEVEHTFRVFVGAAGEPDLKWVIPVPPQTLVIGGLPVVLDVSGYVAGEVETWQASSSNEGVVAASLSGSVVTLTPVSEGSSEVTISARRGDLEVSDTFTVSVGAADGLEWGVPIPPQTLEVGRSPVVLDVSGHVVGEVETWQASSSNNAFVTVRLSGSVVTLTPVSEGSSEVTISARRGDLEVSGTFTVSVGAADGLEWGVPVSPQTLKVGGSPIVLDVSGHVVGEVETWQASSSNEGVVAASLSGSVVTLTPVSAGSSDVTIRARRGDLEVSGTFTVSVAPDSSPEVSIPDANLRAKVRSTLGLAEGDTLTQQKMAGLTSLQVAYVSIEISDLTGLEHATNLTELVLYDIPISDISPIKDLTALTRLRFARNQISDISPIKDLTALTFLEIIENQISDITPVQNLTGLTHLYVIENQVSDITPVQNLTSLTRLYLEENQVSDITPVQNLTALTELRLWKNQISDITPVQNLTALTKLDLWENQISDITPVRNLTKLRNLDLRKNQISDISPLQNFTSMLGLLLSSNQISDISPLQNFTAITNLWLDSNQISDISPLTNMWIADLRLAGNPIEDLAPLRRLKEKNPSISIDITIPPDPNNAPLAPSVLVLPAETALLSNYPNPFNPETWIPYQLTEATDVKLTIYDVKGREVRRLALGHRPAGFYRSRGRAAHWDGRNQIGEKVASGLYFYTLTAGEFTATQKLLIQK